MLSLVSGSHELLSSCYVAYRYVSNKPPEALLIKNALLSSHYVAYCYFSFNRRRRSSLKMQRLLLVCSITSVDSTYLVLSLV